MNVFDKIAHHYDSPKQLELANTITKEIETELGETDGKIGLDYGCGTGLIGLQIADKFKEMLFVDPLEEMIRLVDQKLQQTTLTNSTTKVGHFSKEDTLQLQADLIIVSLVLLHVPDTIELLQALYQVLRPNGRILLVDFDKNNSVYHEKVHNGFLQSELREKFEQIEFQSVLSRTFYHGENLFMNKDASMFILSAEK